MSNSLFDCCFSETDELMSTAEALKRLESVASPIVSAHRIPVRDAVGVVLAEDVVATTALPRFTNVALDGIALCSGDLRQGEQTRLRVVRTITAGDPPGPPIESGTAAIVLTGAPLPPGADGIIMQERLHFEGAEVQIPAGVRAGRDWRPEGEDVALGDKVLATGLRLRAQDIGMLSALGRTEVSAYRPLRIALFSTGNELVDAGERVSPHSLYDVNRPMLHAFMQALPVRVSDLGILPDDPEVLRRSLLAAADEHELIITSGGASGSSTDHVARLIAELGSLNFWRLAIKPGRPLAFGRIGETLLIGLPGNPVAAAVCFIKFVRPLLFALGGAPWQQSHWLPVPAGFRWEKKAGRREWLRVRCEEDGQGGWRLSKHPRHGSGVLSSLIQSDGLAEVAESVTSVEEGDPLPYLGFDQLN